MRETSDKPVWGQVDKVGKGTKANYDPSKKTITFCFNRSPDTSSEALRVSREVLIRELKDLGYVGRMKYNGEVIAENINAEDVEIVNKNHKLIIHLKKKQDEKKAVASSEPNPQQAPSSNMKFQD